MDRHICVWMPGQLGITCIARAPEGPQSRQEEKREECAISRQKGPARPSPVVRPPLYHPFLVLGKKTRQSPSSHKDDGAELFRSTLCPITYELAATSCPSRLPPSGRSLHRTTQKTRRRGAKGQGDTNMEVLKSAALKRLKGVFRRENTQ